MCYALSVLSVLSVFSVRTLFLIFGTNENRGIALSLKEGALTPRCLFSPRSLCSLCKPCFLIFGTNENRGIAPSRKEEALTPRCPRCLCGSIAPSREEGALTPRCLFSPCSLCSLCSLCDPFFLLNRAKLKVGVPRKTCRTKVRRSQCAPTALPGCTPP